MTPLLPGDPCRISGYELLGRLGSGGMGHVYLGRAADGRKVAVKVIRPELADEPEFRMRFRREAAAMMAVSGRYTVKVVGADPDGDPAWLASEYVHASALNTAVAQRGPLPASGLRQLAAGLAGALAAIHRAGLTHRDLKPSNVLLARDGPRVIDFGLAVAERSTALTRAGMVIGTPSYMSPEQIGNDAVGPKSDMYSFGAVLTFAAAGRAPHGEDGSIQELMMRILYRPPNLAGISGPILPLIEACLAKDPAQRPSAAQVVNGLAQPGGVPAAVAAGPPPTRTAPAPTRSGTEPAKPAANNVKGRLGQAFPTGKHR